MSNPLPHFSAYPLEDFRRSETEILAATAAVMQGGHYILGTEVARFEEEFATFCGASYALGVANGTDAIELLLLGLDLGPGDAVAVPSHTAVASISAIRRTGYENWLRNIAVALGNAATTAVVVDALQARAGEPSEVVREHVAWALQRHAAAATPDASAAN